jgi:hypothetical protein
MKSRSDQGGYEPRFVIERVDGQPIPSDRRYMVLSFDGSDPEAVRALLAYASFKEDKNPKLALDIRVNLSNPKDAPAQHRYV